MREIKFRGKRVDNKEWVYGFYWASLDPCSKETKWRGHYIHNGVNIEEPWQVVSETVGMQSIINGVEIYEGDLHKTEPVDVDGEMKSSYLPIVFDNGDFWLDESFKKDGSVLILACEYDEPLNIVGNIHENLNLLNK